MRWCLFLASAHTPQDKVLCLPNDVSTTPCPARGTMVTVYQPYAKPNYTVSSSPEEESWDNAVTTNEVKIIKRTLKSQWGCQPHSVTNSFSYSVEFLLFTASFFPSPGNRWYVYPVSWAKHLATELHPRAESECFSRLFRVDLRERSSFPLWLCRPQYRNPELRGLKCSHTCCQVEMRS